MLKEALQVAQKIKMQATKTRVSNKEKYSTPIVCSLISPKVLKDNNNNILINE